jgi:hypothetical protein
MDDVYKQRLMVVGKKAVEVLNKKGFKAQYVDTKEQALEAALSLIDSKATVGFGGSMTVKAVGLKDALLKRGHVVFDHQGLTGAEERKTRRAELTCGVFVASSNALTLEGELINTDGIGNRIAAMTYGPDKVLLIIGANKIVKDEAAGRERIRRVAAPLNAFRLHRKTPCAAVGYCMDCSAPDRQCNGTIILHRPTHGMDFNIIVVGEALGY